MQFAGKIKWRCGFGNIFYLCCFDHFYFQLKTGVIGTEKQAAAFFQQVQAVIDQGYMVLLNIQNALHTFTVAESGRV